VTVSTERLRAIATHRGTVWCGRRKPLTTVCLYGLLTRMTTGFIQGRALRPTRKVLPGQARGHNRSLVLQTLYRDGGQSRADIARATGLTRVTVSDLVGELVDEGLILELGTREDVRPGKPATLL